VANFYERSKKSKRRSKHRKERLAGGTPKGTGSSKPKGAANCFDFISEGGFCKITNTKCYQTTFYGCPEKGRRRSGY